MPKRTKATVIDPVKLATTSEQQRFNAAQTALPGHALREETAKTLDLRACLRRWFLLMAIA